MYDLHDLYDTSDKHDVQDIVALSIGYIVHWESINLLKCASYDFISKLPSRYQCSGTMADPPPFHSTATGSKPAATRSGALKSVVLPSHLSPSHAPAQNCFSSRSFAVPRGAGPSWLSQSRRI